MTLPRPTATVGTGSAEASPAPGAPAQGFKWALADERALAQGPEGSSLGEGGNAGLGVLDLVMCDSGKERLIPLKNRSSLGTDPF